jgi:O-acetyl-ADP-ribose deacetylase (regulator of RNase III)
VKATISGATLQRGLGDIPQETTDTIINVAHSSLLDGGGVVGAIHRTGGAGHPRGVQGDPIGEEHAGRVQSHGGEVSSRGGLASR